MTASVNRGGARATSRSVRRPLSDEVAAHVREMIVSGEVAAGDYLRMEPLAEQLGVSITPVREGLLTLSTEGFVEQVPRRGFKVVPISTTDVRDIFWAQAELASELAARSARVATDAQVDALRENLQRYEGAIDTGTEDEFVRIGHDFHRQVNLASGSHRLALLLGSVVKQLPNSFYGRIEGKTTTASHDHAEILEAIASGDEELSRSLMRQHLMKSAENLIKELNAAHGDAPE